MREARATHSSIKMNQRSFASAEYAMKKKRTRREKFLADMERVVPWSRLIAVIEPLYPTSGRVGRQPIGVPRMLRMYCAGDPVWRIAAQQGLNDPRILIGEGHRRAVIPTPHDQFLQPTATRVALASDVDQHSARSLDQQSA
jgi:hypothetical protein